MRVVDGVFAVLALPWLPWVLAAGIMLLAFVLWQGFLLRLAPLRRALARAIELLDRGEGAVAFRQRFPSVFEALAQDPVLGEAWRSYASTLTPVPGNEQTLGSARAPHNVFDDTLFARVGINLRFYQAVPNILVGLGLLFTFLGLVAALHFASGGVIADDIREAQAALRELLAAATFKFVTSIAGLGASLVFSWREKVRLHAVQAEIGRFCRLLEARVVPLTPEALLADQIRETQQIGRLVARMGRSLIIRAPEGVEERLADELTLATRPLKAALERVARRFETLDERVASELVAAGRSVGDLATRTAPADAAPEPLPDTRPSMERQASTPPPARAPDERTPAPPRETQSPAMRQLLHRLDQAAVAVQDGLDRLRGRPPLDRGAIEAVLLTTHDRVRDARHTLNSVAEAILGDIDEPDAAAAAHELLGDIDTGLKEARQALQEAFEGVSTGRRSGG
ncbi:MAG: hypothetical protein R3D25_13800 [Geminicoccaceae bacterium]